MRIASRQALAAPVAIEGDIKGDTMGEIINRFIGDGVGQCRHSSSRRIVRRACHALLRRRCAEARSIRHSHRRQECRRGRRRQSLRGCRAHRQDGSGLRCEQEGIRRLSGSVGQGTARRETRRQRGSRSRGDELCLDFEYRLPCPVHAGWICPAHLRAGSKEKCRPLDDAEFRRVRVRLSGLLRGRICVPIWRRRHQRRTHKPGRHPHPQSLSGRKRSVGICRRQGIFSYRSGLRQRQQLSNAVRSRVHGDCRLHNRRRRLRAHHFLGLPALRAFHRRDSLPDLRLLDVGWRMAFASRIDIESGSRLRRLCRIDRGARRRRFLRHGSRHHSWVRALGNMVPAERFVSSPLTTSSTS